MPDGTSRFKDKDGKDIFHFMGCSTMSEYTVLAEISCAKISKELPLEKASLFGCGVSTGLGAVWNTCKVEVDSSVAVFGLGAVGLAVIQGAKMAGASRIIAVDINPDKFAMATELGATDCVDSSKLDKPVQQHIVEMTKWGVDYTFDCTGIVSVMRAALECSHRGESFEAEEFGIFSPKTRLIFCGSFQVGEYLVSSELQHLVMRLALGHFS